MILDRKAGFARDARLFTGAVSQEDLMRLEGFLKIEHLFNSAMREISAKLETLDDEFQILYDHNPIHHLEARIKSPVSIADKLRRKGLEVSAETAVAHLTDIAGVRVICYYLDDVYRVADMLLKQDDVALLERIDYIETPKENGYRSLHLVVQVPVFLSQSRERVAVEVQLRTVSMDYWASAEHQLTYKREGAARDKLARELLECAQEYHALDVKMQSLRRKAKSEE